MKHALLCLMCSLIVLSLTACGGGEGDNSEVNSVNLESLSIQGGTLDQEFQSAKHSYTATVGFLVKSVKVRATTAEPGVIIKVNDVSIGSDHYSHRIALEEGINPTITITVSKNSVPATYNLTITRQTVAVFAQQSYIKASNTEVDDQFSHSISLSGDTLAVSAYGEDSNATGTDGSQGDNSAPNSGAVYVFTRIGETWTQQAYIKASNTGASDSFGHSISLSGDTLAVGAYGESSSAAGIDGPQHDNGRGMSGAVYVFIRNGTIWSQQAYLKASNPDIGDRFGHSVSLSGDSLAVGSILEDSNAIGIDGDQENNIAFDSIENGVRLDILTFSGSIGGVFA